MVNPLSRQSVARRAAALISALVMVAAVAAGCGTSTKSATAASQAAGGTSTQGLSTPAVSAESGSGATGSGQCPTSNTTAFAKTKFLTHTGLAFGAFHRYLWKPYQAGTFTSGAHGRITAFVKGGLAAAFIAREVRLASGDVQANPTLCHVIGAPLAEVGSLISSAVTKLKGGDPSGLTAVNDAVGSVTSGSARQGVAIQDDPNPNLSSG